MHIYTLVAAPLPKGKSRGRTWKTLICDNTFNKYCGTLTQPYYHSTE